MAGNLKANAFDAKYYARYYRNPRTRVAGLSDTRKLANLTAAFAAYLGLPLKKVMDLGCGLGHWREALRERHPKLRYTGVEYSDYLCREYGWEQGSAVTYKASATFDLVICQGVLQYLGDAEAIRAMNNFARLSHGLLFLEALTREDWQSRVDRQKTDGAVHLRPALFYRRRLARHFKPLGGGLFIRKTAPVTLFSLEETG